MMTATTTTHCMPSAGKRTKHIGGAGAARAGFSLVEVVLAISIASFAMVACIGLISVGLAASRESIEETVTSLIYQDVAASMAGRPFAPQDPGPRFYYSQEGVRLEDAASPTAYFEVSTRLVEPGTPGLLAVVMEIKWPLTMGALPASPRKSQFTTMVTTSTPPAWKQTQSSFEPKIDL